MSKFHQLLAVVNDRQNQMVAFIEEAVTTFKKKPEHFDGLDRTFTSIEEDGKKLAPESKEVVTTVGEKILFAADQIANGFDASISKEMTNSSGTAKAVLTVSGKKIGEYSATALLAMETHLTKIRRMYQAIPTRDGNVRWAEDTDLGRGIVRTPETQVSRLEKRQKPTLLAEATPQHKAQVELVPYDAVVGSWKTIVRTGKISSAEKADLLERTDVVIDAVKSARAQANDVNVVETKVAGKLFKFINGTTFEA